MGVTLSKCGLVLGSTPNLTMLLDSTSKIALVLDST